eukprot:142763-Prymnesium_polylepis.1
MTSTASAKEIEAPLGAMFARPYVALRGMRVRGGSWVLPGGLAGLGLSKEVTGTVIQALKHPLGLSCQRTTPRNTRVRVCLITRAAAKSDFWPYVEAVYRLGC